MGVIKKKRKTLLARILGYFKSDSLPSKQDGNEPDVPLDDVRTDADDVAVIAARRDELRAARHGRSNAAITFDGHD